MVQYERPTVRKLGTFREMTQAGGIGPCADAHTVNSPDFQCPPTRS